MTKNNKNKQTTLQKLLCITAYCLINYALLNTD